MPAPANDNFANAEVISGPSGSVGPVTINSATTEASEELAVPGGVRQTIWYEWTAPASGLTVFTISPLVGGGRAGWMTIWTGSALGSLTNATGFTEIISSGADGPLVLDAVSGTTYKIQLGADETGGAATGTIALAWDQPPASANDDFADALAIAPGSPVGPIAAAGATVEIDEPSPSVMFGDGPFQTTWYEWTPERSYNAVLDLTGSIGNNSGGFNEWIITVWTGSSVDDLTEVASADLYGGARTLSFDTVGGTTYRIQVGTWGGYDTATVELSLLVVLSGTPDTLVERPWRFVVTRLDPTPGSESVVETVSFLDRRARDRTHTRLLNRSSVSTGTVASDDPEINIPHDDGHPFLAEGVRCLLGFRRDGGSPPWKIYSAELLLLAEDVVQDGIPVTHYTSLDSWEILNHRPVLKADGTLPPANGLKFTAAKGNEIALNLLKRTIDANGSCLIDFGEDWGGTAFYSGTIEDTAELDIEFQRASTVGEAWSELCQTGSLDIVLTPIYDPVNRPGYLCEGSIYTQAGSDKPNAIFAWDRPPRTLIGIGRLEDGTKRANKVQYIPGQGGTPIAVQTSAGSVADYGEWWSLPAWPGKRSVSGLTALAQEELLLRKRGQTTVTINPAAENAPIPLTEYDRGDRVQVWASKRLRKAITGYQRVYGIPFVILDDGTSTIEQLLVSADSLA